MSNKRELIGRVGVDSGQIVVLDPCYMDEWVHSASPNRVKFWGRDASLLANALRKAYPEMKIYKSESGSNHIWTNQSLDIDTICHRIAIVQRKHNYEGLMVTTVGDETYSQCCEQTTTRKGAGEIMGGLGLAIASGQGDGVYPVYATRDTQGHIKAITIKFL